MSKIENTWDCSRTDDVQRTVVEEGTLSAGETGSAADTGMSSGSEAHGSSAEVIIGEIPDARDLTRMLWTARCSDPEHDLLGRFGTRQEAERTKDEHLSRAH